jgi:mono/diheme cytochrome c family protein
MKMNKLNIAFAALAISVLGSSCVSRGNDPGWEYAPDMYYSKGYEPYNQADSFQLNPHGMSMRNPVAGTIAHGKLDFVYNLPNTGEGYERSATEVTAPANVDGIDTRGKYMYEIYCSPCHGIDGKNDGAVFQKVSSLKPAWKSYQDEYIQNLEEGKIYHTLTYGKNNMGSHASVLTPMDRWRVIKYVKQLSGVSTNSVAQVESEEQEASNEDQSN